MAVICSVETDFGEVRDLYIRVNNIEASNHGSPSVVLFRGFMSKEAFQGGKGYAWEKSLEFFPDISSPLWEQAYAALAEDLELDDAGEA